MSRTCHDDVSELDEIVKSAVNEMETDKEFEKFREQQKVNTVKDHTENNRIYGMLKDIERHVMNLDKDVLSVKKQNHSLIIHAITELHFIRKHQGKFVFISMGVVFVAGIAVGTQYESWLPYIDGIWELLKIGSKAGQ